MFQDNEINIIKQNNIKKENSWKQFRFPNKIRRKKSTFSEQETCKNSLNAQEILYFIED